MRTWGVFSTGAADVRFGSRLLGPLPDYLDGVVSVSETTFPGVGGNLERLLAGLSCLPGDVERIAYFDDEALGQLEKEPVMRMIAWLDDDHSAVVRARPVTDALKLIDMDRIVASVDREGLFVPRPPHIIRREALVTALLGAPRGGRAPDDPAAILMAAGHPVRILRDNGPPVTLPGRSSR